jgi:DNA-binding NarL/FixJ family response regulator
VVAYARLGPSNRLIVYTSLGLSISTVATHPSRDMRKLDVGSRVELSRLPGPDSPEQAAASVRDRGETENIER